MIKPTAIQPISERQPATSGVSFQLDVIDATASFADLFALAEVTAAETQQNLSEDRSSTSSPIDAADEESNEQEESKVPPEASHQVQIASVEVEANDSLIEHHSDELQNDAVVQPQAQTFTDDTADRESSETESHAPQLDESLAPVDQTLQVDRPSSEIDDSAEPPVVEFEPETKPKPLESKIELTSHAAPETVERDNNEQKKESLPLPTARVNRVDGAESQSEENFNDVQDSSNRLTANSEATEDVVLPEARKSKKSKSKSRTNQQPQIGGKSPVEQHARGESVSRSETLVSTTAIESPSTEGTGPVEATDAKPLTRVTAAAGLATNSPLVPSSSPSLRGNEPTSPGQAAPVSKTEAVGNSTSKTETPKQLQTNPGRIQLLQRVSKAFQRLAEQGGGQLKIKLHPPRLGSVGIELNVSGKKLQTRIVAETDAARNIIREHLPELRNRLAEHGFQLESVDVTTDQGPGQHRSKSTARTATSNMANDPGLRQSSS